MRRAMSLIELLVVIAIIAVLASMLVPVVGMLRSRAEEVRCLGSLRQLGMAAFGYATDNRATLPMASLKTSQGPNTAGYYTVKSWYQVCMDQLDETGTGTLVANRRVNPLTCRAFARNGVSFGWMTGGSSGYGINAYPWSGGDRSMDNNIIYSPADMSDAAYEAAARKVIRQPRLPSISQNSLRVYIGDGNDGLLEANGSQRHSDLASLPVTSLFWKGDPTRHRGSANYVFCDGRVGRTDRIAAYWGIIDPGSRP
jgi:prepilin-type N-terminal cleavage/methylation domain-containing protein/prepilin-type processing-associated H-X9-DG protein